MALKNKLDTETVGRILADWLPSVLGAAGEVEITDLQMPAASGMSSETILFEASWDTGTERRTAGLVLRVPPEGAGLFNDYDIAREGRVMAALAKHSDIGVPGVLAHETTGDILGVPFLLLERAYGRVPGDDPPFVTGGWVVELSPEQRAAMFDNALRAIAGLQRVDPVEIGLHDIGRPGSSDSVLERDMAYWKNFYTWAAGERRSPTVEAAFELLEARRPADGDRLVVSWGDARFGNLMFGDDMSVTGVFDWEMATLGQPEVDFGHFLFFDRMYSAGLGLPKLPGFPDREAAIARFEELSGHKVADIDWFEAWGALRGAILLVRVGNLLIDLGLLPPDADMPLNNPAAQVLAQLLDLPAPSGQSGWITGNR
jgi:aminoglycoside phosphotransferase (APT) family kinase protein